MTRPKKGDARTEGGGVGRNLCSWRMECINLSYNDCCLVGRGASFRREAGTSGGRDRMNSNISSCASFLTFCNISPFTSTCFNLYLWQRISSSNISYGVSSNSVRWHNSSGFTFFNMTPFLNSLMSDIHNLAQSVTQSWSRLASSVVVCTSFPEIFLSSWSDLKWEEDG